MADNALTAVAIVYEDIPLDIQEAKKAFFIETRELIERKPALIYDDKVYPIAVKPTADDAKEAIRIANRAALASEIRPDLAPAVIDGITPLDIDGNKNVTILSVGDLSFLPGARVLLTSDGKSRISRLSAAKVNLDNLTVEFLPAQTLIPGTYAVISGVTMVGTAKLGALPVNLGGGVLKTVGTNLVAVLSIEPIVAAGAPVADSPSLFSRAVSYVKSFFGG